MQGRRAVQCRVFTSACCLAVLSVLADRAVAQQAVSQPSAALTAMDYIAIQQLVYRLYFSLGCCRRRPRICDLSSSHLRAVRLVRAAVAGGMTQSG